MHQLPTVCLFSIWAYASAEISHVSRALSQPAANRPVSQNVNSEGKLIYFEELGNRTSPTFAAPPGSSPEAGVDKPLFAASYQIHTCRIFQPPATGF
jgi:hypothetical protein